MATTEERVKAFFAEYSEGFLQKLKELGIEINELFEDYEEKGIIAALKLWLKPMLDTNEKAMSVYTELINRAQYTQYPPRKSEPS